MINNIIFSQCKPNVKEVYKKIFENVRISCDDALVLYQDADLASLSFMSSFVKEKLHSKKVYFVKNYHIEPTNICIHNCKFCSFSERISGQGWSHTAEQMLQEVKQLSKEINELHIVGAVYPDYDLDFYCNLLSDIKKLRPDIHIKAFSAVEIDFLIKHSELSISQTIKKLIDAGLDSIPGGGAEIFDSEIRNQICPSKTDAKQWLLIHEEAHKLGLSTNSTMLYGFFETYEHRVQHMNELRKLQDKTNGFNAFIPLKFKNSNNEFSHIEEISVVEEMRNYAVARLFFDNIPHLKVYWPMTGIENSLTALRYGADDFDGTIEESTKIYEMAGSVSNPSISAESLSEMLQKEGYVAVERDAMYNEI